MLILSSLVRFGVHALNSTRLHFTVGVPRCERQSNRRPSAVRRRKQTFEDLVDRVIPPAHSRVDVTRRFAPPLFKLSEEDGGR